MMGLMGLVGCGGSQPNEQARGPETTSGTIPAPAPQQAPPSVSTDTAPLPSTAPITSPTNAPPTMGQADPTMGQPTGSPGASGALGSSAGGDALSDAQIAQVADAANTGEIEQGRYAAQHATSARVKKFGQHMVTAHGTIGQKVSAVLKKEGITPAASQQSTKMTSDARQTLDSLKSRTGGDFDKAYIDAQVAAHQEVLSLFDNKLIPNAQDAQLKSALQEIRPMIADHLKEAQDIQSSLGQK
jgi:putative membrane protein